LGEEVDEAAVTACLAGATDVSISSCPAVSSPAALLLRVCRAEPHALPWRAVPKQLSAKLQVPRFVVNDYNQRLQKPSKGAAEVVAYAGRHPRLLNATSTPPWPLREACPSSLHLLLAVQSGSLEVRAFSPEHSRLLGPVPGEGLFPHVFSYEADVWGPGAADDADAPWRRAKVMSAVLGPGEALFVPRDFLATWRAAGAGEPAVALAFCYVDASNLNAVKAALELEGHLSRASEQVLQAMVSADFDTNMVREPQALSYAEYGTWPRGNKAPAEAEAGAAPGGGRRRRGNFKEWQMSSRWNYMVLGLTLPAPSLPEVRAVGRSNVTIEWTSAIARSKDDVGEVSRGVLGCCVCMAEARRWVWGGRWATRCRGRRPRARGGRDSSTAT
jgi:hypothetical protein